MWTGLTYEGVSKHFPESEETWKGHWKKVQSGLRSTKRRTETGDPVVKMEDNVEQKAHHKHDSQSYTKTKRIMTKVIQLDVDKNGKKRLIYTDGTGRFPKSHAPGRTT